MYCEPCKQGMQTRVKKSKLVDYAAILVSKCLSCPNWEVVAVLKNFFKEPK